MRKSIWITCILIAAGILIGGAAALASPTLRIWIAALNAPSAVREYGRSHSIRKLQIGAGGTDYPGWLNTDIVPGPSEIYLDATKRFPMADGSIQYVFGEHVIEHLSYEDGLLMLRECYRVLSPGGKIRFATPNLLKYVQLFQQPQTDQVKTYLPGKVGIHSWPDSPRPEVMILNLEMRSFGHKFLYDPAMLSDRLTQAGFRTVAQFSPGESDDPELRGVESRHTNVWRPVNDYEAMVLQAVRP